MHTYIEDCLETTAFEDDATASDEWDELVQTYGDDDDDVEECDGFRSNGTYTVEDGILDDVLAEHCVNNVDTYPCNTR